MLPTLGFILVLTKGRVVPPCRISRKSVDLDADVCRSIVSSPA